MIYDIPVHNAIKRSLDVTLAAFGLAVLSPVLVIVAIAILFNMGSPVLFRQVRPGYRGQPFTLLKFRTMKDMRDSFGNLSPDGSRLTWLGRWLRRFSVDELPELWNVFTGKMSLVGPRPLLMQYLERYTQEEARRHEAKPGITGWAQVNGRNSITWERKIQLDLWYVDHSSLSLDVRILLLTFWQVGRGVGVSHDGHATMPEFRSSASPQP